jgi:hypothetical protein
MEFPPCPENRDTECVFSQGVVSTTLAHPQRQYRRDGTPVGSDENWQGWMVTCSTCSRVWHARKKGSGPIMWIDG